MLLLDPRTPRKPFFSNLLGSQRLFSRTQQKNVMGSRNIHTINLKRRGPEQIRRSCLGENVVMKASISRIV